MSYSIAQEGTCGLNLSLRELLAPWSVGVWVEVPGESGQGNYSLLVHSGPQQSEELLTVEEDTVKEY